jgi:hypothetical protein
VPGAVIVLPSRPSSAHQDLATLIADELAAQGTPVRVCDASAGPPEPGRVVIAVGPREQLQQSGPDALGDARALRQTIVIADDPPGGLDDEAYVVRLRRAGAVFVLDARTAVAHRRHGSAAQVLRLGYVASRDRFDPESGRALDIVTCGERTARRERELAPAGRVLLRHRCELWPPDAASVHVRAKVAMNLHRDDGDPRLRWNDVLPAIHAGAVIVSEHATDLDPLVVGEHLLVADAAALPYVAEWLLADGSRLDEMRRAAHRRIAGWLPFALSVSALRVAIVQLAGQPRPPAGSSRIGSDRGLKSPRSSR